MINDNTIYFYCALHTTKSQWEHQKRQTSSHNTIKRLKKERYFQFLFERTLSWRGADGLSLSSGGNGWDLLEILFLICGIMWLCRSVIRFSRGCWRAAAPACCAVCLSPLASSWKSQAWPYKSESPNTRMTTTLNLRWVKCRICPFLFFWIINSHVIFGNVILLLYLLWHLFRWRLHVYFERSHIWNIIILGRWIFCPSHSKQIRQMFSEMNPSDFSLEISAIQLPCEVIDYFHSYEIVIVCIFFSSGQGTHSRGHLPVNKVWPPLLHRGRLRWAHHVEQQWLPPWRPQLQWLSSEMVRFWDSWWGNSWKSYLLLFCF